MSADALGTDVRSFLTAVPPRHAAIATVNADGSPHQVVIWFLVRGETLVVNSRHGRRWPANLRREGRASLSVFDGENAVTLECRLAQAYEGDSAQADIAEMARRYYTADLGQSTILRFRTQRRVSFVLQPGRVHIHGDPR